ncbi:peptidoglycan endopeptidase [Novosphingobium sp. JCM 18896]|uniref:peptidoglycan endopeptidase n=1 Tax=Novosphingobium sp. JCM 18896 TaxID=2989731 RepID=UPI0022217A92|nr:peptidoglycan endopeptidase [Novosphingobium sp. JCM 18896]MCW1429147.1 peptidoglycan endopeptidase [Novosphingobium sp. JCM 18896]
MTGEDLARAAEALVGARFRLHGRDPATGLDCLGVLTAAFAGCGRKLVLPTGYALRAPIPRDVDALAAAGGLVPAVGSVASGDVMLLHAGPGQIHCAIATAAGHVHAHAGLRRVVVTPGVPAGTILRHWRLVEG